MSSGELSKMEALRAEFMLDVIDQLTESLLMEGFDRGAADRFSCEFAISLARKWEGSHIYIPKLRRLHAAMDRVAIRAQFKGKNYKELADRFGKHIRTIYKIAN